MRPRNSPRDAPKTSPKWLPSPPRSQAQRLARCISCKKCRKHKITKNPCKNQGFWHLSEASEGLFGPPKWPPGGSQEASKKPQRPQGSRKEAPRRPQDAPRRPQDAPRRPFGGPEPPPEPPRCPQEASQTPQITPKPLQRSIFVAKRTKPQALLQIFTKYENAQTPRKMHGFENFRKASNALFGHQQVAPRGTQEPPKSPHDTPKTPPRRLPRTPKRIITPSTRPQTPRNVPRRSQRVRRHSK